MGEDRGVREGLLLEHDTVLDVNKGSSARAQDFVIDDDKVDEFYKDDGGGLALNIETAGPSVMEGFDGVEGGPRVGYGSWWQPSYYIGFFDVTEDQVKDRLQRVFVPTQRICSDPEAMPDLYGPLWIATTLVVLIPMAASLRDFVVDHVMLAARAGAPSAHTFQRFSVAASFLYGYLAIASSVVWITRKYFGLSSELFRSICVYGYSLAPFIPATILCSVPGSIVAWVLISLAYCSSAVFQWLNLWHDDEPETEVALGGAYGSIAENRRGITLGVAALAVHALFAVFLRLYFFH
eukprot:Plantae.Rhodophyta-Rhodochaete_pulchella.ctg19706.p1 GENE.Plantae.Rhodophyta-Rhodochaete_pulchella.ctg19706~~Plantae.Rhodophyta-Rhodochaete_pulchella.ctg19706.p1  ORF type:complete len:294 (+),score=34.20 Plantae.Rhodophyta-Rhodochaete_pulchella.ctg19706:127-1008(+)